MRNAFGFYTEPLKASQVFEGVLSTPFQDSLRLLGRELMVPDSKLNDWVKAWWVELRQPRTLEGERISPLRAIMARWGVSATDLAAALKRRASLIVEQISPFLDGGHVVDWGCGDGLVAAGIGDRVDEVSLLDIEDHRACLSDAPLIMYDGSKAPSSLKAKRVDVVLLLTVLHHAVNPGRTLGHVVECAPERILVIESVPHLEHAALSDVEDLALLDRLRYEYCGFTDWIYNRVICEDVQITFNYLPTPAWIQMFEGAGFQLVAKEELGLDQGIVPEWHVLMEFRNCRNQRLSSS